MEGGLDNDEGLILKQIHMNFALATKTEGSPKCLAKGAFLFKYRVVILSTYIL